MYSCEPGYWLTGLPERHCLKNGSWSGHMPSCIMPGNTYVYNFIRSLINDCNSKSETNTKDSVDEMMKSKPRNTNERPSTDDITTVQLKQLIIHVGGIN